MIINIINMEKKVYVRRNEVNYEFIKNILPLLKKYFAVFKLGHFLCLGNKHIEQSHLNMKHL